MTWQVRALIGLVLTCFAFLSIGVLLNSDGYKAYHADLEYNRRECKAEAGAEEGKHTKECQSLLYRTLDDPVALLTGALTVATVGLFIATYLLYAAAIRQGAEAKDAVKIARETSERQLRAYVGIRSAFVEEMVIGQPLYARFYIRNAGQTPAFKMRHNVECWHGYTILNQNVFGVNPTWDQPPVTLWPDSEIDYRLKITNCVNREDIQHFEMGIGFNLAGRIIYTDVFGSDQFTNVTMWTEFQSRKFVFAKDGNNAS